VPDSNFQQLHLTPMPVDIAVAETNVTLPDGKTEKMFMLMFNSTHGVHHEFLPLEMARQLAHQLTQMTTGLTIATDLPSARPA
jgi:hypothetical protein